MFGLGVWELLIILGIVLVIFGPRRLKTLGSDLGNAIKGFRSAVQQDEDKKADSEPKVIENEAPPKPGQERNS
ncbi:MAG: twin-arginine translocase TatA/TatE family subunit [Gammaproteobacteria bacterium]|nr:twin-arginine translocase TatA/TatE family subunit [Gammaproteobacteria bacterium]